MFGRLSMPSRSAVALLVNSVMVKYFMLGFMIYLLTSRNIFARETEFAAQRG